MVEVFERGSLSAAAKAQYVTVQAVSKAISDLEREIGSELFVRESKGVRPTMFGRAFYPRASAVLAGFDSLEEFALQYEDRGAFSGCLRLALNTPAFHGNDMVRANTAAFIGSQLGVDTSVALATGSKGVEGLRAGVFDALITVGTFVHSDVDCRAVGMVPSGVLMREDHQLAANETVTLEDLTPYPVALSRWFDESNSTLASNYLKRCPNLNFVEVEISGVSRHLHQDGVIFTTGIPALGRMHPGMTLRLVAQEDSVMVPICLVSLKEHSAFVSRMLEKLFDKDLSFLGLGKAFSKSATS